MPKILFMIHIEVLSEIFLAKSELVTLGPPVIHNYGMARLSFAIFRIGLLGSLEVNSCVWCLKSC